MSIDADFSAVNSLAADLGKAGVKATRMASLAVRKTALDIERDAKTAAPFKHGNLRNSISTDVVGLTAQVGPTADYGAHVEYGTYKMAPQPYMGPSTDRHEDAFYKAMEQAAEL